MSHKRKAEDDPPIDPITDENGEVGGEDNIADSNAKEEDILSPDEFEISDNGDDSNNKSDADSDSSGSIDCTNAQSFVLGWLEDKREAGEAPFDLLETLGINTDLFKREPPLTTKEEWGITARLLTSPQFADDLFRAFYSLSNHREKLPHINTFDDAVELIRKASNIVILTGAGVSVSCGIPDFRSPGGLYEQIEEKYHLPDPQCLFDIHYLRDDPAPFFEFAREIYPGKHTPSPTHYFIKELQSKGKLLRNYTQNIDTLEMVSGIELDKLVNCHGSFATASCIACKSKADADAIRDEIMAGGIPKCKSCNSDEAFMKPDIVFFGEQLPDRFSSCFGEDRNKMDLLIVMGSSLKVKPVALIPEMTPSEIPQILVNREIVAEPHEFDYAYLGDCDNFVKDVCIKLGWTINNKAPEEYPSTTNKPDITAPPATTTISTTSTITISTDTTTITATQTNIETSSSDNNGTNTDG